MQYVAYTEYTYQCSVWAGAVVRQVDSIHGSCSGIAKLLAIFVIQLQQISHCVSTGTTINDSFKTL